MKHQATINRLKKLLSKEIYKIPRDIEVNINDEFSKEVIKKIEEENTNLAITTLEINNETCVAIVLSQTSQAGVSLDGDRVYGYQSLHHSEIIPLFEKDRIKLEDKIKKENEKVVLDIDSIGKKYFKDGKIPTNEYGWKLNLKSDKLSFDIEEQLKNIVSKLSELEYNSIKLSSQELGNYMKEDINKLKEIEGNNQKWNDDWKGYNESAEIRTKFNNLAVNYLVSGKFPVNPEYLKAELFKDPTISPEIIKAFKDMLIEFHKSIDLKPNDLWHRLQPYVEHVYSLVEVKKSNKSNAEKVEEIKERMGLASKFRQAVKNFKNTFHNDNDNDMKK